MGLRSQVRGGQRAIAEYAWEVQVVRKKQTTDELGGLTESTEPVGKVWAKIEPLSNFQAYYSGQTVGSASHQIFLREDPGVHQHDHVIAIPGGQEWDVVAVQRTPGVREVELRALEVIKKA